MNKKKGKTFKGRKVLKNQIKNKKMRKYPALIPQRYLLSKERNVELVVECLVSSPSRNLNGEQLTDEAVNLGLKILKNKYPSWNGFEDTTLGPIRQYSHHEKNFIQLLYSDHH